MEVNGRAIIHFQNSSKYAPLEVLLYGKGLKAARRFIQLCRDGVYACSKVQKVIKSEYVLFGSEAFEDQERLSVEAKTPIDRRGLVGFCADSCSDFIVSLDRANIPNCNVFGYVPMESIYGLQVFQEAYLNVSNEPVYPVIVDRIEIVDNPFDDIFPRVTSSAASINDSERQTLSLPKLRSAKLLSFYDDEDEDGVGMFSIRSCHEVLADPKLSKVPVDVPVLPLPEPALAVSDKHVQSKEGKVIEAQEEPAPEPRAKEPEPVKQMQQEPSESVSELYIKQYIAGKSSKVHIGKRPRFNDVSTMLALNTFCSRLRTSAPDTASPGATPHVPAKTDPLKLCRLHGLVNCGSCKVAFPTTPEDQGEEQGWMWHRLSTDKVGRDASNEQFLSKKQL